MELAGIVHSVGMIGLIAILVLLTQSDALRDTGQISRKKEGESRGRYPSWNEHAGWYKAADITTDPDVFLYFVLHQMGGGGIRSFLVAALGEMYGTPEVVAATALSAFTVGSVIGILSGGGWLISSAQDHDSFCHVGARRHPIALLGWFDIRGVLLIGVLAHPAI